MENINTKKKVISSLLWKFGERISAQIISLIVSIILARLLTPEDYGLVSMVLIFIGIANVFVTSGVGNALIQKKDADDIDFSSIFYLNLFVGVLLYVILYVAAPYVSDFYNKPILTLVLRILGIRIIIASINTIQQAYVSKHMMFKKFFWSTLFGTLFSGVIGIWMAYKGFGLWSLVAQYLVNVSVDTTVLFFTVDWRPRLVFSIKRAKSLFSYGWKLLVSGLIDTGYTELCNLIIGKKYSSKELAFYSQGNRYPNIVVTNINASISSVIFPALSSYQNDIFKLKQMTRRAIQLSSFILWPMLLGFSAIAEPVVKLVLTDKWLPCVPYIRVFCLMYGIWPIHTANLQAIKAIGRSDLFLKMEIVKKIIGITVIMFSMQISPMAMSVGLVITNLISGLVNYYPNKRLLNYSIKEQIWDVFPSFVLSIVMAIMIYPLSFINFSPLLIVILQICSGIFIYFLLNYLLKNNNLFYLINLIMRRKES